MDCDALEKALKTGKVGTVVATIEQHPSERLTFGKNYSPLPEI